MASTALTQSPPPPIHHLFSSNRHQLSQIKVSCSPRKNRSLSVSAASSNWDQEEQRWLREEQRWIREEQRWMREESRWMSERETLVREVVALKLRIEELERLNSGSSAAAVVRVLKEAGMDLVKGKLIAERGSGAAVEEEEEEVVVEEVRVSAAERVEEKKEKKERVALRKGAEGPDVLEMQQEALLKLGFYSGEEDMEFSSFSSDTERAVKTWQSTLGTPEDGIMTSDLLDKLFMDQGTVGTGKPVTASEKEIANEVSPASVTEISEFQQTIVKENGNSEVEVSHHRVYLLGENRWEEPSRLNGKAGRNIMPVGATKCLACRGEGRVLCMECDGTGEPNIEPQFLEWVGEGTKCPYCEGLGYTTCDICEGRKFIQT
ncbi:hypothetical protein Sjap_008859 [Stephania japonica]|uniref:Peptidoglycan binding-like domain-containing protein n=1 Tax=Stephania japonica TaxID=461633 RepID=A0AAP0PF24_9MAGN